MEPKRHQDSSKEREQQTDASHIRGDLCLFSLYYKIRRKVLIHLDKIIFGLRVIVLPVRHLRDLLKGRFVEPRADCPSLNSYNRPFGTANPNGIDTDSPIRRDL